jgi:hypothetical protein
MLLVIFSIAHPWGIVAANDFQPAAMVPAAESEIGALGPKTYLPIVFLLNGTYLAGCAVFPADNVWNTPVDNLPVLASSDSYINNIGKNATFHADFGSGLWQGAPIGIPFVVVPSSQPNVAIHYTNYGNESDPGPFPIPANAPIEGGSGSSGDRHVLVLENGSCMLYELYNAHPQPNGDWNASSGAKYDLKANGPLRTAGWTSADAAGLPILPGLARYDEVAVGEIRHALRFTVPCTANNYIWPARHRAGSCGSGYPPMGQRFRLKASFNVASAPAQVQVILRAMKKYGIIVADNGSAWYITGEPNPGWDNDQLHWLDSHLHGSDIEAVDTSSMILDPNSGQARQP